MAILNTQRCPRCRSLFSLVAVPSLDAPSLQSIKCPVCGQVIYVAAPSTGFVKYIVGLTLEKYDVPANVPEIIIAQTVKEENTTVWKDFSIIEPLKTFGLGVSGIGLIAAIIVIIFLMRSR